MYPYVHCSVIYNSQDVKAIHTPINRRLDKEVVVHIYNGILLGRKKNEILPLVTAWMDPEGIILSEVSQTEKDKHHMTSFMCRI